MTEMTEAYDWRGRTLIGPDGEKIGKVEDIYVDEQSGRPEWARISTGLLANRSSFVPLAGATPQREDVVVHVTKGEVKDSPNVDSDEELSQEQEVELFRHYGIDYIEEGSVTAAGGQPSAGAVDAGPEAGRDPVGHDVSGPETDDAMTRSEEEVHVGKANRERGRARLRKYVVTEEVQQTVPVQREEVRLEREPITDANVDRAAAGPAISEEEHEVVLYEEQPVVEKRAVPKERVRMSKDTVVDEEQVSEEVRKEQIEAEGDMPPRDIRS
ncbi:MAG TPA: PRC and DUF2382 domain-containing protein [Thermoleophilaceae bacterium]|nr:PRC and DUF2382 domain-containing protein [Thermoleophilaceae bacterium]